MRALAARYRALGEGKKREESQGSGSTTKTAAREAAREESLSPQEYKNQWGDEQRSNCKNSNRGKHVEKRRTERMRVGGYKAQTWKEKVLSTAILAYSTSERAAFARESLTTDLETTLYIFRLSQLDFCHYTALLCMHSNLHSDFCHCSALNLAAVSLWLDTLAAFQQHSSLASLFQPCTHGFFCVMAQK